MLDFVILGLAPQALCCRPLRGLGPSARIRFRGLAVLQLRLWGQSSVHVDDAVGPAYGIGAV